MAFCIAAIHARNRLPTQLTHVCYRFFQTNTQRHFYFVAYNQKHLINSESAPNSNCRKHTTNVLTGLYCGICDNFKLDRKTHRVAIAYTLYTASFSVCAYVLHSTRHRRHTGNMVTKDNCYHYRL